MKAIFMFLDFDTFRLPPRAGRWLKARSALNQSPEISAVPNLKTAGLLAPFRCLLRRAGTCGLA